jgi:hypothetical protein
MGVIMQLIYAAKKPNLFSVLILLRNSSIMKESEVGVILVSYRLGFSSDRANMDAPISGLLGHWPRRWPAWV